MCTNIFLSPSTDLQFQKREKYEMRSSNKNPLIKDQTPNHSLLRKSLSLFLYVILPLILLFHFYCRNLFSFPSSSDRLIISSSPPQGEIVTEKEKVVRTSSCDYSDGEWIPNKVGPLYNGTTCDTIKPGQNCMLFGRPDQDYLHWEWKPKTCKLPRFEPETFLKLLKNKHVAFVGDSLARNQLESLLCILATVSKPNLYYTNGDDNKFRKWHFGDPHNVNVSIYWSPFLASGVEKTNERNFNMLHLDSVDEEWGKDLENIDMLVLSAGHWFLHPAVYYYNNSLLGCHFLKNCTEIGFYDVFGKALKTVFGSVIERKRSADISVFLTTFSPHHFEGEWDKLGACSRTRPYNESEIGLEGMNEEMRKIGVENVREAKLRCGKEFRNNVRFEALDVTKLALLRPDGHPGPYMNPFPFANGVSERVQNDCVHWCLPGPIDTWNEILLDVVKRWASENMGGGEKRL